MNEAQLRRQLRAFANGNRSVSNVKALRNACWIVKDTENGGWKLSDLGLYYLTGMDAANVPTLKKSLL